MHKVTGKLSCSSKYSKNGRRIKASQLGVAVCYDTVFTRVAVLVRVASVDVIVRPNQSCG